MKSGATERLQTAAAERRVHRARILTPLSVLAVAALMTLLIQFSLEASNALWIKSRGEAEIVLRPIPMLWLLFTLPIGIGVGVLLWDRVNAFFLAAAPPRFSVDYSIASMSTPRWFRLGALTLTGFFAFLSLLNIRRHVRFTEYAIVDQRALGWRELTYPYAQVASVRLGRYYIIYAKSSRGGPSRETAVFVYLKDGRRWSTRNSELNLDEARNTELAQQIAARSGVPVEATNRILDEPMPKEKKAATVRSALFYSAALLVIWLLLRRGRARQAETK